jgi:D-alanyl-lipoteichoic acid acyltransferase DltB (MBOAT superfamily)
MSFASISFVIFFPVVVALYYICPARFRWALLLAASCYFYMAFIPQYILILFAIIIIDFVAAQQISTRTGHSRRLFLLVSILSNVGILFVFKYFNFFNANFAALAHALHWNYSIGALALILPLGLSFHTFQSLSYIIEVYRGNYPPERHLGKYALYVMFFPQLIAGPIERPGHLLPQLKTPISFDVNKIYSGLRLMLWGFFKKVVVADRLAIAVDYVWHHTATVPGPGILAAMVFFSFQLYADFSGYSDIARGSARVLGIEVMANFNRPYFSASVAEFWRRWHISLSGWFRDYVYIPLGGNRVVRWKQYRNTLIVFLIVGVWHGAGWTFVMMGFIFGFYICIGLATKQ